MAVGGLNKGAIGCDGEGPFVTLRQRLFGAEAVSDGG
jgi:hypothetical protein